MDQKINVQDLFAVIGEQTLSIRMLQQQIATMQRAIDDLQKSKEATK